MSGNECQTHGFARRWPGGGTDGARRALFATMRLGRKLIQGRTVALLAVGGAQLAMRLLVGEERMHLGGLALSVGIPSFLAAVLLFPVSGAVVACRWRLGARVVLATAAVCVANRLLVFRVWEGQHLSSLIPNPAALDGNARLLLASLITSLVMTFVAQPVMVLAAQRR